MQYDSTNLKTWSRWAFTNWSYKNHQVLVVRNTQTDGGTSIQKCQQWRIKETDQKIEKTRHWLAKRSLLQ